MQNSGSALSALVGQSAISLSRLGSRYTHQQLSQLQPLRPGVAKPVRVEGLLRC